MNTGIFPNSHNFFTLDFAAIKSSISELNFNRSAELSRVWENLSSSQTAYKEIRRILDIALPFISLHDKGAIFSTMTYTGINLIEHAKNAYTSSTYLKMGEELLQIAFTISLVAFQILNPLIAMSLSSSLSILDNSFSSIVYLKNGEYQQALFSFLKLVSDILHVASTLNGALYYLALSILSKALVDFYMAYSTHQKNQSLETFAHLLMGVIRTSIAFRHGLTLHRFYFGKILSQHDLDRFLGDAKFTRKNKVQFDDFLKENGFSGNLSNLSFRNKTIDRYEFKYISFEKCQLSELSISDSKFEHTTFANSQLKNVLITNTIFNKCFFKGCQFYDFSALRSHFYSTSILSSNLQSCIFNESKMDQVLMMDSTLQNSQFLHVDAKRSLMIKMKDLKNCFLCEAAKGFKIFGKTPYKTKPVVALEWNFLDHGYTKPLVLKALEDQGAYVLAVEHESYLIDPDLLEEEIQESLKRYEPNSKYLSIGQYLLHEAKEGSEVWKTIQLAKSVVKNSDGISLPGGRDIEPELYGHRRIEEFNYCNDDYRNSLFELALIDEAHRSKVPIMGTCRGSQMLNIYFGGTSIQYVENHNGIRSHFEFRKDSQFYDWAQKNFPNGLIGVSLHHQASDKIGSGLDVIFEFDGVPELFSSKDELILGSQFHPEFYIYDQSNLIGYPDFFEILIALGEQYIDEGDFEAYEEVQNAYFELLEFYQHLRLRIGQNKKVYKIFFDRIEHHMSI